MAKKTNLEVLIESSWKVNLAVSIILYIIYLVLRNSNIKAGFFNIGPIIAPALKFLSIIIFFIAVISFFVSLLKNQKFKNTISLDDIKKLSWQEFESLIESFYKNQGYSVYHSGGENVGDGGIDIVAKKNGEKLVIQCKHWKAYKVDVKVIREMYGVMVSENASKAVVICSGDFTQPAIDFVADKPVELINGKKLIEIISKVKEKHNEKDGKADFNNKTYNKSYQKKSVLILNDDRDSSNGIKYSEKDFMPPDLKEKELNNTSKTAVPPLCPFCHKPMVLRVATRGEHQGKKFWGCSNYPKCSHTEKFQE